MSGDGNGWAVVQTFVNGKKRWIAVEVTTENLFDAIFGGISHRDMGELDALAEAGRMNLLEEAAEVLES